MVAEGVGGKNTKWRRERETHTHTHTQTETERQRQRERERERSIIRFGCSKVSEKTF